MTSAPPASFNFRKIIFPVVVGFSVSGYMIYHNFNPKALALITVSRQLIVGSILAALLVVVRDFCYILRLRMVTDKTLKWSQAFQVIMLWEFGSMVAPGAVGGSALALFVLRKERISYGRIIATLMLLLFFDNFAFVAVFSVLFLLLGPKILLVSSLCPDLQNHPVLQAVRALAANAWIGYVSMLGVALALGLALFVFPLGAKKLLYRLAALPLLNRWAKNLKHIGDEIEIAAQEFRLKPFSFFLQIGLATVTSWLCRYLLANALLFAFAAAPLDMVAVLARQYVLWIFLIIPSTPGASGVAEIAFTALNCEFIAPGLAAPITLLWRMFNYYLYLLMGIIVLPKWLARVNAEV